MIEFHHVTKRYEGGYEALSNVSLSLGDGEMAFLTGHSGAGKSTLLKIIALIEKPTRGQALLNRINLNTVPRFRVPYIRRNIGIIFQDHQLLFDRPVFDNVAMPLHIQGYPRHEIARRTRAALDKVGLLHKEKSMPINQVGVTVLVASHDLALIDELDKPRVTLNRGELILNDLDSEPQEIRHGYE